MNRAALLTKFFRRNADPIVETPEGRLWLAVLNEALTRQRKEKVDFFRSRGFDVIANFIGLNATFARESIVKFDNYNAKTECLLLNDALLVKPHGRKTRK